MITKAYVYKSTEPTTSEQQQHVTDNSVRLAVAGRIEIVYCA